MYTLVFGCLLVFYGSTLHPGRLCGGFGPFFLFSMWSPCYTLSRKKKRFPLLGLWGAVGTVSFIWARRMAQIMNFDRETFLIHALAL